MEFYLEFLSSLTDETFEDLFKENQELSATIQEVRSQLTSKEEKIEEFRSLIKQWSNE